MKTETLPSSCDSRKEHETGREQGRTNRTTGPGAANAASSIAGSCCCQPDQLPGWIARNAGCHHHGTYSWLWMDYTKEGGQLGSALRNR